MKIKSLIDTGAEISLINEEIIKLNLNDFENNVVKTDAMNLVTANNKKFSTINKTLMANIEIAKTTMMDSIMIMKDMKMDCILGMDLLEKFDVRIDVPNRLITVRGDEVDWIRNEKEEKKMVVGDDEAIIINNINGNEKSNSRKVSDYFRINNVEEVINWNGTLLNCEKRYVATVRNLLEKNIDLVNNKSRIAVGYEHKLQVNNENTFKCKNYPIPHAYQSKVWEEINKMIRDGVIVESSTSFINPLVVVKKKDGNIRLCLDAKALNNITRPQFESPQGIENLLGKVGGKSVFTKLDLKNSFWLIPLEKESQKYTGFSVDGHTFIFQVVPFGLSTSSSALVKSMQKILKAYDDFCVHYVDDILIFSEDATEHEMHLFKILEALNKAGLKLNVEKCEFFKSNVKYLGYKISTDRVEIDQDRLKEIREYARPKNLRTLRGFIGVMNYYKRFIEDYSNKILPLLELLKKGAKWKWDKEKEETFNYLRNVIFDNISLHHPDFTKKFLLRTDASKYAVSAVLTQTKDNLEIPICFASRTLRKSELNYTVSEKEMLAIVFALMKLRFYLIGNKFEIETDHAALTFLMSSKFTNNRIYRWSLLIQEYDFNISHIKGKNNIVADAFSRKDNHELNKLKSVLIAVNELHTRKKPFTIECVKIAQMDEDIYKIKNMLNYNNNNYKSYKIIDECVIKKLNELELYVINKDLTKEIAMEIHLKYGHIGVKKTWLIFRENYYCKKDRKIIKKVINDCFLCLMGKYKNYHNENSVQNIEVHQPGDLITIDYVGNLIMSGPGLKNILVVVDAFSKFVKLYPTRTCTTDVTIELLEDYLKNVIKPKTILADNATYFNNGKFRSHWAELGIRSTFCSIRHPQGNLTERYILEVIKFLRLMTFNNNLLWYDELHKVEKFINETPSTVTEQTPLYLMKGILPSRPWLIKQDEINYDNILEKVRSKLKQYRNKYLDKMNNKIKNKTTFKIGDLVIVRALRVGRRSANQCAKLLLPFEGPYKINRRVGENTYELVNEITNVIRGRFHLTDLYAFNENEES